MDFTSWLFDLNIPSNENWLILGDFNFIRSPNNRNKPGGDAADMLLFNEFIRAQSLMELPVKGRSYTWSNMQDSPLLEKLDWVFTSTAWTISYPNTMAFPMAMTTSDHIPIMISIGTNIPKSKVFRFENYGLEHTQFREVVQGIWAQPVDVQDSAKVIATKFKRLRKGLKIWAKDLSQLSKLIQAYNDLIFLYDTMGDFRPLSTVEWNGREIIKQHLLNLLEMQRAYWRQRATIRWILQGEEVNTKYLKVKATINYRRNYIASL